MTRTGKSPRLNGHIYEPYAELNPVDAGRLGVAAGQLVELETRHGRSTLRLLLSESQRPGSVFVPMHCNDQFASSGAIDRFVNACNDPVSGQPEFKHTPVQLKAWKASWYGFVLSRHRIDTGRFPYWEMSNSSVTRAHRAALVTNHLIAPHALAN